jgi:serine/threonine protein kinase
MTDLVGTNIGKYRVVARLGRGGMAEVYKAFQPGLNRYVAIKVLHSHLAGDEDFVERFEREATAVATLPPLRLNSRSAALKSRSFRCPRRLVSSLPLPAQLTTPTGRVWSTAT